jgi:peptide/nickel transport system substrate-binding protein
MHRLIARTFILATLMCLLLPAAARVAPARADSAVYGGTLIITNAADFDNLDPQYNSLNETIWMIQNIYERLVQPSVDGTKIEPQLAASWSISSDALTYTFHLRKAVFSNGEPVKASDVAFALLRCMDPKTNCWAFLFTAVKSVTTPNDSTLVIHLKFKWAPLLADLAIYATGVFPVDQYKKDPKNFFNHPIGSGPYQFVSWDKGTALTLKRNALWWGPKPYLDSVVIKNSPNDSTRVLQLQGKQTDVIENPPFNLLAGIQANPDLRVDLFPSTRVDFLQIDEHFAPFKDKLIRQAMNYAIDRNAIIKIALSGHGTPASSFMPPMLYWNPNQKPYPYDLAKAKALMAKSTYPQGFKCNLIEVSNDVPGNAAAVIIKSELAQIGIDVSIQGYDIQTAYAKMDERNGNPPSQLGARYWTNDIIDPDEVVSFAADINAGAHAFSTWYNNPVVIKLVHQGQQELDAARRRAIYYQIQATTADDAHLMNLYYSPYRYAHASYVHGFQASPLGTYRLKDVWVSPH